MNHFEYEQNIDDLGVTVIENAFLNHYMPNARGDYVKVYLFGLKVCAGQNQFPTNLQIAQALKLTESDVINAWKILGRARNYLFYAERIGLQHRVSKNIQQTVYQRKR
jgi:hypothetical protein